MRFEKETKERFIKMLDDRQVIVIQCNKCASRKTYDYKFIGANSEGKWDFTPLVAEFSGYPSNASVTVMYLAVRGLDPAAIIADTVENICEDLGKALEKSGHGLYEYCRHNITTFYL